MTQHTMDPGTTPEGQTEETGATKSGARPRRRSSGRGRTAPKLISTAPEATAATPEAHTEARTEAHTPEAQIQAPAVTEAPPEAPAETAATPIKPRRASPRARRGRSSATRHEAATTEPAAEMPSTDALAATPTETPAQPQATLGELTASQTPAGANGDTVNTMSTSAATTESLPAPVMHAHEPLRTVPALTPEAWPAPRPGQPAVETEPEPAPTTRYRFGKRNRAAAPAPAPMRPERIGGREQPPTGAPAEEETSAPVPTFEPLTQAHPGHQVSAGLGDLLERLGQREPEPAYEPLPFEPEAPEELTRETSAAEPLEPIEPMEHEEAHPSDVEGTSGRRRRRRRGRGGHGSATEAEAEEHVAHPEAAETRGHGATMYATPAIPAPYAGAESAREAENGYYGGYAPDEEEPYAPPYPLAEPETGQGWNIGNAQQQMREARSPFSSPNPAMARGFGPQPAGVAGPARDALPRQGRPGRGDRDVDVPPMSANQLGSVITQAIQRQTDRLLTELRHQQHPPSMTVMMPNYPSTERVGVFVDVANLHYSARNLRMSIDFGHLLEFLRGNRRLIRAHAYAPTNPDPNADQAFLSAVKGLGYRITTKNFKTFASGAKKADMDLDLCMDIVRMVDAGALDTVVLVSGDSDFLPLLEYCSDHGVRVEVAAFDDSAAAILRQSCDLFINLSMVDDIRA